MRPEARETIFARSSGTGRAGVAVFRISGPRAGEALDAFCGGRGEPRAARLVRVKLPDGSLLDTGLALWFPGPASFTGEDVAELHLHGSPAVERAFADAMTEFGLAPASAGAFTLRAFEAGKLDLTQAEGLGDLLNAETEGQRRQALGQLGGRLSERAERWREQVLAAMGAIEASVDFPDEDDVPSGMEGRARATLKALRADMRAALDGAEGAARLRDGVMVVLTGPPNAGKSSILNRLAGSERAIVSEQAGTTRDILEVRLDLAGTVATLVDTAGVRETTDSIEREGVARARRAAREADVRIEIREASSVSGPAPVAARTLHVANKIDRGAAALPPGWIGISARTGEGWPTLTAALEALIGAGGGGILTRDRHAALVASALQRLDQLLAAEAPPEIVSEALRLVLLSTEELTGRISPDEVLGEVFSAFCIGK